ncbi:MAG: LPP20 family lipoprotein [Bacteroidota bacterium]|nr:LPP20 family lipoprotein [Bacteroidota bacterium]
MRKTHIILSFLLLTVTTFGQNIDQIKANRNTYIWGEGKGSTLRKANNTALSMIISQISTEVESNFTMLKTEDSEAAESYSEQVKSVVNTYSKASLRNTEQILISNEPDAHVFRYIKRSELHKIFEARKEKILGFSYNGNKALENLQIADAIRYYYWALTLLQSHPYGNSIKMTDAEGTEHLLSTWLPFQIKQVLAGIRMNLIKMEDRETYKLALLEITWNGKPVSNLDYSYFNGQNWSNIIGAKDGLGYIELPTSFDKNSSIDIRTEYFFEAEAAIDNELRDVMQEVDPIPFPASRLKINSEVDQAVLKTANHPTEEIVMNAVLSNPEPLAKAIGAVCQAVDGSTYESVKTYFTDDGYEIFTKLLQYGNALVLSNDNLEFMQFGDNVVARSVKMKFAFSNNTRAFVEDVVFTFNQKQKIQDITFGLSQNAVSDILGQDAWKEPVRLHLIDFMEHYKTAFALKRLDYIESVFSDDALIITGWMTKPKKNPEQNYYENPIVHYNRYDKNEYLKHLSYSFKSKDYINIKFNDNEIRKSGKGGEIYGIQIQQDYFSSNYGDSGYLFLLIDMNDTTEPVIHVRTWQPEKNPDGSIYGIGDF